MFASRFISFAVVAAVLFVGQAQAAPLVATDPGALFAENDCMKWVQKLMIFTVLVSACGPTINTNPNLGASCQFTTNGAITSGSKPSPL